MVLAAATATASTLIVTGSGHGAPRVVAQETNPVVAAPTTRHGVPNRASTPSGPIGVGAPIVATPGGSIPGFGAFNALTCSSTTKCVAVGADKSGAGVADTTSDGGSTWKNATLSAPIGALDAVTCNDVSHCVAVGQGVALTSSDGGQSWSAHAVDSVATTTLTGVSCGSDSDCLAAGVTPDPTGPLQGTVMATTDGGSTWSPVSVPQGTLGLSALACTSTTHCVAVGNGIDVTTDGGATWRLGTVDHGVGTLDALSCWSDTACLAVGPNADGDFDPKAPANAIVTSDGGLTWTTITLPDGSAGATSVDCGVNGSCTVGSSALTKTGNATAVTTGDGGATWTPAGSPLPVTTLAGLSCPTTTACVAIGRQGNSAVTARSTDGLASWTPTSLPAEAVTPAG